MYTHTYTISVNKSLYLHRWNTHLYIIFNMRGSEKYAYNILYSLYITYTI